MHCANSAFPGIDTDGGFAELPADQFPVRGKLDPGIRPEDVAALADAGLTAYHAAKKAAAMLYPGTIRGRARRRRARPHRRAVAEGPHVGHGDRGGPQEAALQLARDSGADHLVPGDGNQVARVLELTDGRGCEVVMDFVGEGTAIADGVAMLRRAGTYHVIGYGGTLQVPMIDIISAEINFVGNLVGTYVDLVELMRLAAQGRVRLRTQTYPLTEANTAMDDLEHGRLPGRGILVP